MTEARRRLPPGGVVLSDYVFHGPDGEVRLAARPALWNRCGTCSTSYPEGRGTSWDERLTYR